MYEGVGMGVGGCVFIYIYIRIQSPSLRRLLLSLPLLLCVPLHIYLTPSFSRITTPTAEVCQKACVRHATPHTARLRGRRCDQPSL